MATNLRGPASMGLSGSSIAVDVPIDEIMRNHGALRRAAVPQDYAAAYVLLGSSQSPTATGAVIDLSSFGTPVRPQP